MKILEKYLIIFNSQFLLIRDNRKFFSESLKRKEPKLKPIKCDQEYYNDLPGKSPPEPSSTTTASKSPKAEHHRERLSSNLIDLDSPIEHEYVNEKRKSEVSDKFFADLTTIDKSKKFSDFIVGINHRFF